MFSTYEDFEEDEYCGGKRSANHQIWNDNLTKEDVNTVYAG